MMRNWIIPSFAAWFAFLAPALTAAGGPAWKEVGGTRIPVPPTVHPRLYLRAEHVGLLQARLDSPALKPVVDRLRSLARKSPQLQVELDALDLLIRPDQKRGRQVVETTLKLLQAAELPDRQDACRVTGRWMVTGAIIYDWLYALLTPQERQAFIAELIRLARTQECGYPPTRQGSVTGHASEAQVMRDMLSAGIAIHDEVPEMYDLAAGRFFRDHLPVRNWLYEGHAYHQGDSYGPYRFGWDCFPLWIFDRLGAGNVHNPQQRHVPYFYVYTTRPDGQRLRAGDTFSHSARLGQPWGFGPGAILTASYYGDGYLLSHHQAQGGARDGELIFELLWRDTALEPKPIADLPLSRYFGAPFGWMVARTGWDANAVIAEMKVNVYNFNNHQHMDAGAFQLYHKGALAGDSGLYSGSSGAYGSPHCTNYYWRTIAHNCLLVHDPKEAFNPKGGWGNDGGQRLPNGRREPAVLEAMLKPENGYKTGAVLAHGFGPDPARPDYTLLKGDITAAYGGKVKQVVRSWVFLNLRDGRVPAAVIVMDRVVAADSAFRKFWLLHTLEEPRISGATAVVDRTEHGQRGRLALTALLPGADNLGMGKVGGPGKEYWVFGSNYANDVEPARRERSSMETGAWRIEITPRTPAAEDVFLVAMQVTDPISGGILPVGRLDAGGMVGCRLEAADGAWHVLFARDGQLAAGPVDIRLTGAGKHRLLVTDLPAGQWQLAPRDGGVQPRTAEVSDSQAAAWFSDLPAGSWRLSRP